MLVIPGLQRLKHEDLWDSPAANPVESMTANSLGDLVLKEKN